MMWWCVGSVAPPTCPVTLTVSLGPRTSKLMHNDSETTKVLQRVVHESSRRQQVSALLLLQRRNSHLDDPELLLQREPECWCIFVPCFHKPLAEGYLVDARPVCRSARRTRCQLLQ